MAGIAGILQLTWELQDRLPDVKPMRFLIHDRDTKFTRSFDRIFLSEGIEIVLTPYRAPKANAFAERWIRSLREECLDHLLILNERHLRRVLIVYITFYNEPRPHQGLEQQTPVPRAQFSQNVLFSIERCWVGCCMTTIAKLPDLFSRLD